MKRLLIFSLLVSLFTACDDSENKPDPVQVAVNYASTDDQISEQSETHEVLIQLDEAAQAAGELEILISGEAQYGTLFTTIPAAEDDKLYLSVTKGSTEVSFTILPVNNTKLNGNKTQTFSIVDATGAVVLGESIEYTVTLLDDELTNKLQTQEKSSSGFASYKSRYEYNEDGTISKVFWESKNIGGLSTGTDQYSYNETGGVILVSRVGGSKQTKYIWEGGAIVKSESLQNGELVSYNEYEYDDESRVSKVNFFNRNPAGEFVNTLNEIYTYHEDGNVHEIIINSFSSAANDFVMSVKTTYEEYMDGHNPYQLEVLPGKSIQTKLPQYYSRETATVFQEYNVAYEFSEAGNLTKKTVTGAVADSGVTIYTYY